MIPRKLELKNFLSYGETLQSIDFTKHSLICLSGKNGNGKSALLDALTWAVWGQARKVSTAVKPDEGLIRLGQSRMMVSVEFDLNQSIYRVRREFAKTYGRPYIALDFEVYNDKQNKFLSLTEKSVRQTQEKIERVLGLDYETFINSAFLRQGQSSEFSKKSPKDRKTILANILSLSKYDKIQQLALESAREIADEKRLLLHTEEQIALELAKETDFKEIQVENHKKLEILNKNIDAVQFDLQTNQTIKNKLGEQKKECEYIKQEITIQSEKISQRVAELYNLIGQWRCTQAKSLKVPNITKLEQEKQDLYNQEKVFISLRQESLRLQEEIIKNKELYQKRLVLLESNFDKRLNELKLATERSEFALDQNNKSIQQKNQEIKNQEIRLDELNKEFELLREKIEGKELFEQAALKLKNQFEKRRIFYQSLIDRGNFIKSTKLDLEQRKCVIQDISNPACPLCEQMLTAKRKIFLTSKLVKSEIFLIYRLNRITSIIKKLKIILLEQHNQIQNVDKEFALYKQIEIKLGDISKKIAETRQILVTLKKELCELEKNNGLLIHALDKDKDALIKQESIRLTQFAKDTELEILAKNISSTENEIAKIGEKLTEYSKIQEKLKDLESIIGEYSIFKQEFDEQPKRRFLITLAIKEVKEFRKNLNILQLKLSKLCVDSEHEKNLEKRLTELKRYSDELIRMKETLTLDVGRTDNEIKRLERLKQESLVRKDRLKLLEVEIEDCHILTTAFGKNGIQALLIEQAIPEIEFEANKILARLTDNQAQIFIESLKDLKSGGVKETLDIQISDASGIRPYEMYSGGEAFRIDLAIRIAISKLLAHRAGTALQTLIIDEGFGSQDDDGLAKVMSSILSIQDDFLKIIVVSHLSEFKDNFPIHFIIEKNEIGSTIKIEERG